MYCRMKEFLEKESVTVKDVLKRLTIPRTHQYTGRQIEKVTCGKIEGSVEVLQDYRIFSIECILFLGHAQRES